LSLDDRQEDPLVPLPPAPQPKGWAYLLGTWSGRLIIVNTIIFLLMSYRSGSVFLPDQDVLFQFGAKDIVAIAQGEFWRFLTPVFVHIGILHFAFNTLGLYYIGYQIERILGPFWFLLIYLLAGIFGNISSAVFTVATSAGASGALFGLLGCGFVLERVIGRQIQEVTGRRPQRGAYTGITVVNIVLGFILPGIDNAAHLGGLVTGILFTSAMLSLRVNNLRPMNRRAGVAFIVGWVTLATAGVTLATSESFVYSRIVSQIEKADGSQERYHYLTSALRLRPDDRSLRLMRGTMALLGGERDLARQDLELLRDDEEGRRSLESLSLQLDNAGRKAEANWVDDLMRKE